MTPDPLGIQNYQELAEFLEGRSDEEIARIAGEIGIADILRTVFDRMQQDYLAAEGPRERAIVQWEIRDPEGTSHVWQCAASRDGLWAVPEEREDADVTLRAELVPFLELMARTTRGIEALSAGTLRLKGDIELALEIEAWFPR